MTEKRINELDSPLQQNDFYVLESSDLDSSLTLFAQNDESAWIASSASLPRNDDLVCSDSLLQRFAQIKSNF